MEPAPRPRRPPLQTPGGGSTGEADCSHLPSPSQPQLLSDGHQNKAMALDSSSYNSAKKSGRVIQVTCILLVAIGGTLLFTILLSLTAHFNQPLQVLSGADIITSSSNTTGGRMKHRAVFTDHNATTTIGGSASTDKENALEGLVADFSRFESPGQCTSRGHRPTLKHDPNPYLVRRLRSYEALHRKCARYAENFVNDIPQIGRLSNEDAAADHEHRREGDQQCRFVVWIAYSGLGNRLLSLVSAFLYALLTNRVLLVDRSTNMSELFCEPFAGTSWLLPPAFPHTWLALLNESSEHRFGRQFNGSVPSPAYSYVHLTHTYNLEDRMFFCDQAQDYLHPIPWLFMRANNYIVPGLYFLSSFRLQLDSLFSDKETVFHLLGRYLFHPSNTVWGWINRFRKAYLTNTGKQVGIQIRTFNDTHQAYFQEQLSRCALENKVLPNLMNSMELPEIKSGESSDMNASSNISQVTSILVTSLQPEYYEKIRELYLSAPAQDGQFVAVHQLSHEGWQKTSTFGHNVKAWADIYLLSFSDVLITSGWSTFGYSAQALAGVKPWIMFRSFDRTVPNPPCTSARSIEPCFHTPPLMDCMKTGVPRNPAKLLPFVQGCEDVPWGIKLIQEPVVVV